ncbi:MAG: hypothetical protein V4505_25525 [Pseudomonadota bacterium]
MDEAEITRRTWEGCMRATLAMVLPMLAPAQRAQLDPNLRGQMMCEDWAVWPATRQEHEQRQHAHDFTMALVEQYRAGLGEGSTHRLAGSVENPD